MAGNSLISADSIVYLALLALLLGLYGYDRARRRIPNTVTFPLLIAFMALNWPGAPAVWFGCAALFLAWKTGALGGGDAKLWMGLLWIAPPEMGKQAFAVMALSFAGTALIQLGWRWMRRQTLTGRRSPAAWRTIPYVLWLLFAS